jgi:hypothetical protein
VTGVSQTKLDLFGKTLTAVLLASLLGALVYYSSIEGPLAKPAFAFVLDTVNQMPSDPDYTNQTLLQYSLQMDFTLTNHTTIYIHDMGYHNPPGVPFTDDSEYHGVINETITNIQVKLWDSWIIGIAGRINSITTSGGENLNVSVVENNTLTSLLVTSTDLDMGSYTYVLGPGVFNATSTPGYWPDAKRYVTNTPFWSISSTQFLNLLEGSGNATLRFNAAFHVHMNYTMAMPDNSTQTGATELEWEGTIGTIGFKYDENSIFDVRYDFYRVELLLLTLKK